MRMLCDDQKPEKPNQMGHALSEKSLASRFDVEYPHFPEMRAQFRKRAQEILSNERPVEGETDRRLVGFELEFSCIDGAGQPMSETVRNELVASEPDRWGKELGSSQIEVKTEPVDLMASDGLEQMRQSIFTETRRLMNALDQRGLIAVRLGTNPLLPLDESLRSHDPDRYILVPDFHDRHRRPGISPSLGLGAHQVRVDIARIIGAASSVQFNVDCRSVEEALAVLNYAFMLSPVVLAMTGNSRFLDGKDTGFSDIRGPMWELSHDIRTPGELSLGVPSRVGLPRDYYPTLASYFADLHDQPAILNDPDKALELAVGLFWRDARLKFLPGRNGALKSVVEFRPMPLQQSSNEDFAFMAFSLCVIFGSLMRKRVMLPMNLVHDNRWAAMLHGTRAKLWGTTWDGELYHVPARDALRREMDYAKTALLSSFVGRSPEFAVEVLELWQDRLLDGCPSDVAFDRMTQSFGRRKKRIDRDRLLDHIKILDLEERQ